MGDRADLPERGLPVGGKSVPWTSGQLTADISPWDGQVYARVAAGAVISGALFRNGPLGQARTPPRAGQATLPRAKTGPAPPA